jgi:hypothetical protein
MTGEKLSSVLVILRKITAKMELTLPSYTPEILQAIFKRPEQVLLILLFDPNTG